MTAFKPVDATIGGLLIGIAAGIYMLLSRRVAGNSGVLKAFVVGPRDTKVAYLLGLVIAGVAMYHALPDLAFDEPTRATTLYFLWGIVMGIGTSLGNGCTSGHGLCGISRLSVRSFVAVPIFMITAIISSSTDSYVRMGHFEFGSPAPAHMIDRRTLLVSLSAVAVLVLTLIPTVVAHRRTAKAEQPSAAVGVWCGLCAGVGLAIGGMVRPSCVQAALAPHRLDLTLWVLFLVALGTTFAFYRVACRFARIAEACAPHGTRAAVDHKLVLGAALFGAAWGATGFCPGPLIVTVAAQPTSTNALLTLLGNVVGVLLCDATEVKAAHRALHGALCGRATNGSAVIPTAKAADATPTIPPPSPPASPASESAEGATAAPSAEQPLATVAELRAALSAGAVVLDVRPAVGAEATESDGGAVFRTIVGARSILWEGGQMHAGALAPIATSTQIVVICRTGNRAARAAAFLLKHGYSNVLNGGGPAGPSDLWAALVAGRGELSFPLGGLQQLRSAEGSSTLTYVLTDASSKEAIILDPVAEHIERDLEHVHKLGCTLTLALNTHVHADHVTGSGGLKQAVRGLRSYISAASGAHADVKLSPGEVVTWAGGQRHLKVLATPGHTNGCLTFHDEAMGAVFTGDALLIDGCGRTDFQQGSAQTLYESIHTQLFSLPPSTLVMPGHDYKGRSFSTIGTERQVNPRLTQTKADFVSLMANLGLPHPKKMDVAVPANMVCGV